MKHWASVAEQLAMVRAAQEEFLVRDLIESWVIGPMLLDRLAADLAEAKTGDSSQVGKVPVQRRRQMTDDQ